MDAEMVVAADVLLTKTGMAFAAGVTEAVMTLAYALEPNVKPVPAVALYHSVVPVPGLAVMPTDGS